MCHRHAGVEAIHSASREAVFGQTSPIVDTAKQAPVAVAVIEIEMLKISANASLWRGSVTLRLRRKRGGKRSNPQQQADAGPPDQGDFGIAQVVLGETSNQKPH